VVTTHTSVQISIRMAKVIKNLLIERLESLNIEKIAAETKFKQRSDQKMELKAFLVGFMVSFLAKGFESQCGLSQHERRQRRGHRKDANSNDL
jgi:hypothetical protein